MEAIDAKEAYWHFPGSDFWRKLSLAARERVGFRCQKCGVVGRQRTQAHHRRYPENWFDTVVEDLECLCRKCHQSEHGIGVVRTVNRQAPPQIRHDGKWTWKELRRARSEKQIGREEFLLERNRLGMDPKDRQKQRMEQKARAKARAAAARQVAASKQKTRGTPNRKKLRWWWPGIYEGVPMGAKPPGAR